MRKKIAVILLDNLYYVSDTSVIRGSRAYLFNVIKSLALKNDVDVYCPEKVSIEIANVRNIFYLKPENTPTAEELENKNYDFVWKLYPQCFKNRKFITFDIRHSHSLIYRRKYVRNAFERFMKRFLDPKRCYTEEEMNGYKNTFRNIDVIFANSRIAKDDYVNLMGCDEKSVFVLHPMVVLPKEDDIAHNKNDVFTFGMSAISFSLKGGFIFLNALFNLKLRGKKFKAKIIYPKANKNLFVKLAVFAFGLKNSVTFLDIQNSMKDFYNSVDCLVMPSKEETFGLTAIEAMSYKVPVIASDVAGVADIIKEGENGFLFEIRKHPVINLSKALNNVLNSKNLAEISENAYKTAKENDIEHYCEKMDELFDKILIMRGKQ